MKVIMMNGGLGNQLFQYIFFRVIEIVSGDDCCIDDHHFFLHDEHNGYEIESIFGLKPKMLKDRFEPAEWQSILEEYRESGNMIGILGRRNIELSLYTESTSMYRDGTSKTGVPYRGQAYMFDGTNAVFFPDASKIRPSLRDNLAARFPKRLKTFLKERLSRALYQKKTMQSPPQATREYIEQVHMLDENLYFYGYWIDVRWFQSIREQILQELRFPPFDEPDDFNPAMLVRIQSSDSVSVHVRRGDFLSYNIALDASWYGKHIEVMRKRSADPVFFLFSDDLLWCRQNKEALGFREDDKLIFVDGNTGENSFRDMQLMSCCKNMIIANSSFSYLAALLNQTPGKVVLAPAGGPEIL